MSALAVLVIVTSMGGCAAGGDRSAPQDSSSASTGEVSVGSDGVQSITLVSGDDYRFSPSEFAVTPGVVRVTLDNVATQLTHSLAFPPGRSPADITEAIQVVAPSQSDTIEFTVSTPGEYAFICSFHEALGHTGVMTVQA